MPSAVNVPTISDLEVRSWDHLIKSVVARSIRRGCFPAMERPDLEQALWVKLLKRRHAFRAERASWSTFCWHILNGELQQQLAHRLAAKRHPCRLRRLRVDIDDPATPDVTGDDLGVRDVLALLPLPLRCVAERLQTGATFQETATALGVSLPTIRRRVKQIQQQLCQHGYGPRRTSPASVRRNAAQS